MIAEFRPRLRQIVLPELCTGIAWHPQISARRNRNRTNLRAIRKTGALELLGKEPAHEVFLPLKNRLAVVDTRKGLLCNPEDLPRTIAAAEHVIEEIIMKLVRTDQVLRLL